MRPGRLRTGVMFIGLGVTLLLYNMDRLEGWYFLDLLHLWPVLLVAIGIEIIARNSRSPWFGYISPVLVAGAFVYAGTAGDANWNRSWQFSFGDEALRWRTVDQVFRSENKVDEARVYVDMCCGDLKIQGGASELGQGEFRSAARVLTSISEDEGRAVVRVRQSGAARRERAEFDLSLNEDVPLTLDLKVDDAEVDIDAIALAVRTLYLDMSKGVAELTLGRALDSVWASLTTGSARLNLHVPKDAGLRFEGMSLPGDADFGSFKLEPLQDALQTADYELAPLKITFRLEEPASNLKVEAY
jgi:hypothetical protein